MSNQGAEQRFEDSHKHMAKTSDTSSHLQNHAHQLLKEHSIANGHNQQKGHEPQTLEFNPIKGFDPEAAMQGAANMIKHGVSEMGKQADHLGKEFDKTSVGKKIDEICDHDPAEKIALGTAAVGAGVVIGMVAAPEALLAAGITGTAAMLPAVAGVFGGATYQILHDRHKH
ncbi:MAG TPA: hypothetical protein V6C76_09655 [Drouetiella sp.]